MVALVMLLVVSSYRVHQERMKEKYKACPVQLCMAYNVFEGNKAENSTHRHRAVFSDFLQMVEEALSLKKVRSWFNDVIENVVG
jgi:hypothetical protein